MNYIMQLSVIIPAYNVERYVQACLDSVFALPLTEEEMEVLVIDDGSTDSTPQILAYNTACHSNLRVLHQPNQGQSVARNRGIEEAKGEYILFVDSDDALTTPCPLPFETMQSGKYDMIGVETLKEETDGTRHRYCHQIFPYDVDFERTRDYLAHHNVLGLVYGYLFRTQFLQKHSDLRFTPGIYHQDEEFIVKAFCMGGAFVFKQGYTYIYYVREGSSIHTDTRSRKERLMRDMLTVISRLKSWKPSDLSDQELTEYMSYKLSWMSVDVLRLLIRERHDWEFSTWVLSQLSAHKLYPLPFRAELKYMLFNLATCRPSLVKWWQKHPVRWI